MQPYRHSHRSRAAQSRQSLAALFARLAAAMRRPGALLAILVALLLGSLAFANASAQVGREIGATRFLGGSFHAWRAEQRRLEAAIVRQRRDVRRLGGGAFGRAVLAHTPLSARAMWLVGVDYAARGRPAAAQRAMLRADAVSRRDRLIQIWLAETAAQRGDVGTAMRHFNVLLNTSDEARTAIIERMAAALPAPDAQRTLAGFITPDSVWRPHFLVRASQSGESARPAAAMLMMVRNPLTDGPADRLAYRTILMRLAGERAYPEMLALYRRLPGAEASALGSVAAGVGAYPPFAWTFAENANVSGEVVRFGNAIGLELYAQTGTNGIAALRYVVPGQARTLRWRVVDALPNPDAEARWVLRCVAGAGAGSVARSTNLLATRQGDGGDAIDMTAASGAPVLLPGQPGVAEQGSVVTGPMQMTIPANCAMLRVELFMMGGTGQAPASINIDAMRLQ